MNYFKIYFLIGASVILIEITTIDPVDVNDFLTGEQQEVTERIITKLSPSRSINLSKEMNIHQPYLLTSDEEYITLFDKQNFGFFQFDFTLRNTHRFGEEGRGPGENIHPMSVGSDADGNIWVSDSNNLRVDKRRPTGDYVESYGLPSGRIPYRFQAADSESFILFSILNERMEIKNTFLEIDDVSGERKGFLLDGSIAYDNDIIYYAGGRNGLIKAYTTGGELLYS